MNSVSFTPSVNLQNYSVQNLKSRPAFTGAPKAPTSAQLKKAGGIVDTMYKLIFLPFSDRVIAKTPDSVITRSEKGVKIITKKYPKWSRKPVAIAEENTAKNIKNTYKMHKDGSFDFEVRDTATPGYKISVEYKNLTNEGVTDPSYKGAIDLTYCDAKMSVSDVQREQLLSEFDKSISDKYDARINQILHKVTPESFQEFANEYYKDPEVIGRAILGAPSSLNSQIDTVSGSMPYGIKHIMEKLGK